LAFALEHANLLGQVVALALQLFGAGLQRFTLPLERSEGLNIQKSLGVFRGLQTRHSSVQIFAEKNNIEHADIVVRSSLRLLPLARVSGRQVQSFKPLGKGNLMVS
jgi:hypothetical protein